MKGLLRVTHYLSGGYWIILLDFGFPVLISLLPVNPPNISTCMMFVAYISIFTGMMPVREHEATSVSRWKSYIKTMPYTRRQQVDAKFLYSLLTVIPAVLAALLLLPYFQLRNPNMMNEFPYAPPAAFLMLMYAALTAAAIMQMTAFLLPLFFIRRGGIGTYLAGTAVGAPFVCIYIGILAYLSHHLYLCKWEPVSQTALMIPFLLLVPAVICFVLSWRISRKLYCRRRRKKVTA